MEPIRTKLIDLMVSHPQLPLKVVEKIKPGDAHWECYTNIEDCWVGEYAEYDGMVFTDREEFKQVYYDYNQVELNEQYGFDPQVSVPEFARALEEGLDAVASRYFREVILLSLES